MRDYAKVGGRAGKPAYRTPAAYILKKLRQVIKRKKKTEKIGAGPEKMFAQLRP